MAPGKRGLPSDRSSAGSRSEMGEKLRPAAVSVLGLGNMGSALAQAFIGQGHRVTVWNRSEARSRGLAGRCRIAADAAEACRGADLVVACLSNYQATREALDGPELREALAGRTLVQLATGTPAEARGM